MDRHSINRFLGTRGLSTLDDPGGLVAQLGFLIEGHDQFRRALLKCVPEERRSMFEALRPHLSFEPKPLDVYISEAGAEAEAQQLPTVDAEGNFVAYHTATIRTIERIVDETLSAHHLSVTCRKCTKAETFHGHSKRDALEKLRTAGWTWDEMNGNGLEICPDCPASRIDFSDIPIPTEKSMMERIAGYQSSYELFRNNGMETLAQDALARAEEWRAKLAALRER